MITQQNFENYTKIIIQDIEFCEKNEQNTNKNTAIIKFKKLKTAELDTEDREAITNWYFIISQKSEVDIEGDLNKWLYDFDPK